MQTNHLPPSVRKLSPELTKRRTGGLFVFFIALLGAAGIFSLWAGPAHTRAVQSTTACVIPDTVVYEAEHGIIIGASPLKPLRTNASNDTNVSNHTAVKFVMQYPANAIKLCYSTFNNGTTTLKVNNVTIGTFTLSSTGNYNNIAEAQINVNVNAGDTVYVGSAGVYHEIDCIKAYKAPNKLPYVNLTTPAANDTVLFDDITTITATANDTDGTVVAVKFVIAGDTIIIDSASAYTFNYQPKTLGHKSIVVTAYDNCGDSTVTAVRNFYVLDEDIHEILYEGEHGMFVGDGVTTVYRAGVSNDTNVTLIGYTDKGINFIMNNDADGIILGYGTYQTGTYRLRVNGVNAGLFTIIKTNNYNNIFEAALNVPVSAGDTVFVGSPGAGGAYLEVDYIKTFSYNNIPPSVAITYPAYNDTVYLDSTVIFTATASDVDGTVDSVKFSVAGYAPYVDASAPYTYTFLADSSGFKTMTATAYDNDGDSTVTSVVQFLVRTIIPDSLKYEAEYGIFFGDTSIKPVRRAGVSNDTNVMNAVGATRGIKFVMVYDADAIILGYGTGNPSGTFTLKVNGANAGTFYIYNTGGYQYIKEAVVTNPVQAGDTVYITAGTAYAELDYIKAYNANGFVARRGPVDTLTVPENEDWDYVLGNITSGYTIRKDTLDGTMFGLQNDTVIVTQSSFDYERDSLYYFMVDTGGIDQLLYLVKITNVTGAFDENGFANTAVAAKYPEVNEGDYIYWNLVGHAADTSLFDTSKIAVSYPNKILIHSKQYKKITIDLTNAAGNSTAQPVVVTNFLGQVESRGIDLRNLEANRLTGRYDATNGYGHRYFRGWDAGYEYLHGTFGIYTNYNWASETSGNHINLNTPSNRVELDYLEMGNGGFSAINWKDNGANYTITDTSSVHHCFIHDIGSEGLYLGSTGMAPQQVFTNITVENNVFLRCGGEGIQTGWLMGTNHIQNNVVHSGVDWKRPFQQDQDGVLQVSVIGGGTQIKNNVLMGGGESLGIIELKDNTTPYTITEDTLLWKNNLVYGIRNGDIVHYGLLRYDSLTNIVFDGNYYKRIGDDYTEVKATADTNNTALYDLHTPNSYNVARNNFYDYSVERINKTGGSLADSSNNTQQTLPYPQFRNYLEMADSFNYLNVSRYTDSVLLHPSNARVVSKWKTGNVVQWYNSKGQTRFYLCIQNITSGIHPPANDASNAYWQLLTWAKPGGGTSYFPPDDVRLDEDSYYDSLGMGINATAPDALKAPNRKGYNAPKGQGGSLPGTQSSAAGNAAAAWCKAYPNPASQEVSIESSVPMQQVAIYDALGRQWVTQAAQGSQKITIDLHILSAGIYFVRISDISGQTAIHQLQVVK